MCADRDQKEEQIYYEAVSLPSEQRETYLQQACGADADLLQRVRKLLDAHDQAGSFLEPPPAESCVTLDEPLRIDGPGTVIGRYELLELIGEGGMGLVYLAEQKEPVRRKVALKIIKPGMDSKQVIARFEAERQALALLDHPNIAHVFDAGCTETGRPYFVMEHVKGTSIIRYCDDNRVTIEQRLRLFEQVCEAVHHAHQKGIIHRDLKPSNILVSVHDDQVMPKIIDFGIAKAIAQPLTDKTFVTFQGQLLGTPEYMSPEQVDFAAQDIDTRSDIYSLGVVLYELLAGVLPFESEFFERAGLLEIQQTIREQEPASPSIRLTCLGEKAKVIAASRGTQVLPLARRLHRELEWIPLKAMRKDRCRRYKSAAEMAGDIRNYLNGNPLLAGPETTIYRVQKFVRKHAGSVATVALVAAAIVVGLVVSTAMYFRAESMRVEAVQAKAKETVARTQAEQAEQTTKDKAEELRRTLYVNSIQLADAKYREGNTGRVRELLASCPNDLRGWEWNRLNYVHDQSLTTLHIRANKIGPAAFSSDGKRLVTAGGEEGIIRLWDTQTGAELLTLRGHQSWIESLAFSPDQQRVVSGSDDKTIKIWDVHTGAEAMTLRGHKDAVWCAVFSPDGECIASGSGDATIKLWDAKSGVETRTLRGPAPWIGGCLAFSPDGKRLAANARDNTIRLCDPRTGAELLTMPLAQKDYARCVGFDPDNKRIVSGSQDGTITVWDAETGKALTTNVGGHKGIAGSVTFSPDGRLIASAGSDNVIKVWDAESGQEIGTLRGHDSSVAEVAFSPDGQRLMSVGGDGTIKLWDTTMDRESTTIPAHNRRGNWHRIVFSPDGRQIASFGGFDSRITLWDARTGEPVRTIRTRTWKLLALAFSPDGRRVLSNGPLPMAIQVWDASTGAPVLALRGHKGFVFCAAYSPDGKQIVSASEDKTIKLWDATTGAEVMTLRGHSERVPSVVFSPDGKRIVSASRDKTIKLWDLASGSEVASIQTDDLVCPVAFSPDGKRILSAAGREIKIWDPATGANLMTIRGHASNVWSVAFSPDGKRIVSGSLDGTVKLWDSATGDELLSLHASYAIAHVAFSPDGTVIGAATLDANLVLWESAVPIGSYEPRKNAQSARTLVEELYRKCGSYHDVLSQVQSDARLDASVRKAALQVADAGQWKDTGRLQFDAWETVQSPDRDVRAYQIALEKVNKAHGWEPNDFTILETLGAAQYRLGSYEEALKTLAECARMLSDAKEGPDPGNLAFKAMTLHRLGRAGEAKTTLEQLRGLSKEEQPAEETEVQALLEEAEKLITGGKQ
jgi:WD40 repeat protein/serine/threonine protein kinase